MKRTRPLSAVAILLILARPLKLEMRTDRAAWRSLDQKRSLGRFSTTWSDGEQGRLRVWWRQPSGSAPISRSCQTSRRLGTVAATEYDVSARRQCVVVRGH